LAASGVVEDGRMACFCSQIWMIYIALESEMGDYLQDFIVVT
jgi:hypothetical protein